MENMIIHVSLKNDHQNVLQSGNQNDFLNIKLLSSFTVISFFIQKTKKNKKPTHISSYLLICGTFVLQQRAATGCYCYFHAWVLKYQLVCYHFI